jgi:tetratricopeptide (TPR) repeat protein
LTVREALDRASAQIGQRFQDQPLVEAAIRMAIGNAYVDLHANASAWPHFEKAVRLRQAHLGPDHPDSLDSMRRLAGTCSWTGRHSEGIALRQRILEHRRQLFGPDHPETLEAVVSLAQNYHAAGHWEMAIQLLEPLLEKQRTNRGPKDPSTLGKMHTLAMCYMEVNRLKESMALHEQVLEDHKSQNRPAEVAWTMRTFAQACQRAGKLDRADQLLREALEIDRNHEDSQACRNGRGNTLGWLALNLLLQQRYDEAERVAREAVAVHQNEEDRRYFWVSVLGAVLLGRQKYAEAEPLLLEGYEHLKQREVVLRAGDRRLLTEAGEWIVRFYEATGQPDKARAWRDKVKSNLPDTVSTGVK